MAELLSVQTGEPREPHARVSAPGPSRAGTWLGVVIIVLLAAALRIRLLPMPLERDEGEYGYAGQLILHGIPPYAQMYAMKLPGIYGVYALVLAVFGQTPTGVHLGLLLANAASIVLVFLLGRRLLGRSAGLAAAAVFAAFSLAGDVEGAFANAEHFVLVPALAGVLVLVGVRRERGIADCKLRIADLAEGVSAVPAVPAVLAVPSGPLVSVGHWRVFWAGLLLGLAFIIKQPAVAFVGFGGVLLVGDLLCRWKAGEGWRGGATRLGLYTLGAVAPFLVVCAIFAVLSTGVGAGLAAGQHGQGIFGADLFHRFWFWTFTYAAQYVSEVPLRSAWASLVRGSPFYVGSPTLFLWALGLVGVAAMAWDRRVRIRARLLLGFTAFSFLAVCPGFFFRPHYFVLALPAVALWAGAGVRVVCWARGLKPALRGAVVLVLIVVAVGYMIVRSQAYLFSRPLPLLVHDLYHDNPFPEAVEAGRYIQEHTSPQDTIAVLGSEPEICFYARRRSATGFIYMYPLMERQPFALEMQHQMIREIEAAKPAMMVLVWVPRSWLRTRDSDATILTWFDQYCAVNYRCVGMVDLSTPQPKFTWDEVRPPSIPAGGRWMGVYQWQTLDR